MVGATCQVGETKDTWAGQVGKACVLFGFPAEVMTSMNITATLFLAFGMSMDAFAASLCKGAALRNPRFSDALRTGLIFGVVEAITPLIGWSIGQFATQYVMRWDHWIAFTLLLILGGRMIMEGVRGHDCDCEPVLRHGFWLLVMTAIATSIDAMAVGVSLAFMQVNIVQTALCIGTATFIMSTLGMTLGRVIGPLLGNRAEILGGVVLIAIGSHLLYAALV